MPTQSLMIIVSSQHLPVAMYAVDSIVLLSRVAASAANLGTFGASNSHCSRTYQVYQLSIWPSYLAIKSLVTRATSARKVPGCVLPWLIGPARRPSSSHSSPGSQTITAHSRKLKEFELAHVTATTQACKTGWEPGRCK